MENAKSKRIQNQLRERYKIKDKQVKKNFKEDKRKWLNDQMDDAQKTADMGNMKTLYEITKSICNEKPRNSTAINDKEEKTITEDSARLTRWKEYSEEILNREAPTNPLMIDADIPEIEEINTEPISKDEVRQGIRSLKNGKAGRVDNIVAEFLKADLVVSTQKLHGIIQVTWEEE